MAATITSIRPPKTKVKPTPHVRVNETPPDALRDRERLLAALAALPPLDPETWEQFRRDIQEAREASIAGPFD